MFSVIVAKDLPVIDRHEITTSLTLGPLADYEEKKVTEIFTPTRRRVSYFVNGILARQLWKKDVFLAGTYTWAVYYHQDGITVREKGLLTPYGTHYKDWCWYAENGNLVLKGSYNAFGCQAGEWEEYYPDTGTLAARGRYDDRWYKVGTWMEYRKNSGVEFARGKYDPVTHQKEPIWNGVTGKFREVTQV